MKSATIGVLAAGFTLASFALSHAQPAESVVPVATPNLRVPTTKVLAIGTFTSKSTPNVWRPMLPAEARSAVRLYLDGKIDQWYVKQDDTGIVIILTSLILPKHVGFWIDFRPCMPG